MNSPVLPGKPNYVYVASSWSNAMQAGVCAALRAAGIDHYDFKNPPHGKGGFHWSSVMPSYQRREDYPVTGLRKGPEQLADQKEYLEALQHPIAIEGFTSDMDALKRADCVVCVLPSGRSAHLETGWAAGAGVATAILLDGDLNDGKVTPELMYKMVDYVSPSLFDLLGWLGVGDD